jgi:hypothetical protein
MTLDTFFARIDEDNRRKPGTHRLEPALSDRELLLWEKAHPGMTIPEDLVALFRRSNGFSIHLDSESPVGANFRLLSLNEFQYAARFLYLDNASCDEDIPETWLGVGEDVSTAHLLLFDCLKGEYLEADLECAFEAKVIARGVEGMLEWVTACFVSPDEEGL